ncbi:MAG: beta-phosphoglucomutase-like phosphatase (HAD superfamily), partial [Kiritimatiellia bacterium]
MANLKLVVWDLETALVDMRAAAADALHNTLSSMGHELPVRHALESQGGLDPDAYIGQLCPELSTAQHRAVVARFCTTLELSEHDQVTATNGVADVLSTLKQHRFLLATIGWSPSSEAHECLQALGLHGMMDRVVGDGDVARPWPHPAAL